MKKEERIEYIYKQIDNHLVSFKNSYPNTDWFAIVLQGSQNYNLDIYTDEYKSDVDTKIIVVPSLEDIVLNKQPLSTTHVLPNNEHCDIKDIRLMFDNFKKQNINFLEILFSIFGKVNKKYTEDWIKLYLNKEDIAHYNTNQALRCMAGMSMEKKKALCHPYPSIIEKIEKYGYDGKQLHHIIRMYDFITGYALGATFEECLNFQPHKEEMLKAKLNQYSLEEAIKMAKQYDNFTKIVKDSNLKEKDKINKKALEVLNEVQFNVIKKSLREEILKDE